MQGSLFGANDLYGAVGVCCCKEIRPLRYTGSIDAVRGNKERKRVIIHVLELANSWFFQAEHGPGVKINVVDGISRWEVSSF